jgi:hydroxymethylpyrimidine pyrophosphatase-like HAD family hydrolase
LGRAEKLAVWCLGLEVWGSGREARRSDFDALHAGVTQILHALSSCARNPETLRRSDLEDSCGKDACVTRAMDRMLEVLPFGASKASGVVKALELLGMRPGDCLAMGDGMRSTHKSNRIPTSEFCVFLV